jgi:DNA polymerase-1
MQADYSQLELRVAAELSDDDVMRELFRSGVDFHLGTAKLISQLAWGIPPEWVTKVHRSGAKEFNFGLLYGKTDRSLAAQLGISLDAARAIRKAIFGAFAKLGVWHHRVTQEAKELGGCWTYWEGERARWRPLLDLGDDSEDRRGYYITALNGAVNSPVQGTASDFCIASLARCVEAIERKEMDAELILPIHDSLMFLVPERKVAEVSQQVHSIMTGFAWCKTPMDVDVEVGERWGSLEKLKVGRSWEEHQVAVAAEKALKHLDVRPT